MVETHIVATESIPVADLLNLAEAPDRPRRSTLRFAAVAVLAGVTIAIGAAALWNCSGPCSGWGTTPQATPWLRDMQAQAREACPVD